MAKRKNPVTGVQGGFDFIPITREGREVPWAACTPGVVAEIEHSVATHGWVVVDTETTGLTPGSSPVNISPKEWRMGADSSLRMRVITVLYLGPDGLPKVIGVDLDRERAHRPKQAIRLVKALLSGAIIGHNIGFDIYWLRTHAKVDPKLVVDTMLLGRVLRPDLPVLLQQLAAEYNAEEQSGTPQTRMAYESVMAGKSGWSLADIVNVLFDIQMDKGYQSPKNWCVSPMDMSEEHYAYATGDVWHTYAVLQRVLGMDSADHDVLGAYAVHRAMDSTVALIEPLIMDVIWMREVGLPIDLAHGESYVAGKRVLAKKYAAELVALDPALEPYSSVFADPDKGLPAQAKLALADAFRRVGLTLAETDATGTPMVGEKDLRYAGGQVSAVSKPLFDAWVGVAKSKKLATLAEETMGFARRSADGRIHALLGFGPVTGRLSAIDPNVQQWSREQEFRNICAAPEGQLVLSCDYGALDMRVGAALAIRAQRLIADAFKSGCIGLPKDVADTIRYSFNNTFSQRGKSVKTKIVAYEKDLAGLKIKLDNEQISRKAYFAARSDVSRKLLLARFSYRLLECREKATAAGTSDFSALRDAFVLGVDIHTFTAIGMIGLNPSDVFKNYPNMSKAEKKDYAEDWKKKLKKWNGQDIDRRQNGKVANLSLLYAMKSIGFRDTAARNYNVHWDLAEADSIRVLWLDTFPEVDLWHCWTELNPWGEFWGIDPDKGGRRTKVTVYEASVLDGRRIMAFGLNAALSYQDQSTGGTIAATAVRLLRERYPHIGQGIMSQVHDELLILLDEKTAEDDTQLVMAVMNDAANKFIMPFGVPSDCSPALGKVWIKD